MQIMDNVSMPYTVVTNWYRDIRSCRLQVEPELPRQVICTSKQLGLFCMTLACFDRLERRTSWSRIILSTVEGA